MTKSLLLFLIFYFLIAIPTISAQTEIKFNTVAALVLVPNGGIELAWGEKNSVQLDVLGSFWDSIDDSAYHINQTFLEYRWYQKPKQQGWFLGTHIGYGMFTLRKPNLPRTYGYPKGYYQSGRNSYYGITVGYKRSVSYRWGLEAFLGGGFSNAFYRGYLKSTWTRYEDPHRQFNLSSEWIPYRGGVMLVYKLKP
ncbi:DUF3575 domain-containing protein [Flavobacteriaceae bacterium]|nr:DUF3575 domain-containing protein [Flavobacteriaceae bacterium]